MNLKERVVITGFGQCGNQITNEFEQLNYNTFYVNTSASDFPKGINANKKFLIDGAQGCAKDMDKAVNYGVKYFDNIIASMTQRYPMSDIYMFIFSGGGGTGAGLTPLILDVISTKYPDKKYCAAMVLPSDKESLLSQDNAKKSLKQLFSINDKLASIHLLDNNTRENVIDINTEFAVLLDSLIDGDFYNEKGNIDEDEKEELLVDQGITTILEFENDDFKIGFAEAIKNSIYVDWNRDAHYIGLILNSSFNKDEIIDTVKNEFGEPLADFATYTDESNKIIVTGTSLKNTVIKSLNKNIKKKLQKKEELALQKEDENTEDNEDIDISSLKHRSKKKIKTRDVINVSKELDSILNKYKNM